MRTERCGWIAGAGLVLAAVLGCGGDGGGGTGGGGGGAVERTLSTCATSVPDDAPEPFRSWFRCVTATVGAAGVTVSTESLPPHRSYYYGEGHANFAAFDTSRGAEYHPNPNTLVTRAVTFTIPAEPIAKGITVSSDLVDGVVGTSAEEYPMGPAGIAIDSVPLFNPLAAPGDDIEAEKYTFDGYEAHPAPDGTYHYHTTSPGPLEVVASIGESAAFYGVMCDGTVVIGCTELDGTTPDAAGLDAQGGHVHDLAGAGGGVVIAGRYHTHVCPTDAAGRKYTPEVQYYTTCDP